MKKKVTKAIFPVAGLGTRFLPATKSIPKEIMTLVDRPLIQYAIDEARAAGIKEFIFVTSRGKGALEDYFDHAPILESSLRKAGKTDLLEILKMTNMESGAIAYIRQHRALGLGHAVWCARRLIGDEPFAVIKEDMGSIISVKGMVEKPAMGDAPSNLAVIGRYILTPDVLESLNRMKTGAAGEIQLTDAIAEVIGTAGNVYGYRFRGQRFDCGSKAGFLQATVAFALARPELRDELMDFLGDITAQQKAAQ
jgi:UTP--glucose-1-phosphate uridylyltransferase